MNATLAALTQARKSIQSDGIETRPFVDGRYFTPDGGALIDKTSPIDGQVLPPLHDCGAVELDLAVRHASLAFRNGCWRNRSQVEKKETIFRLAALIEADIAHLAYLDTLETGRAYANFFHDSIPKAVKALRWFAEGIDKYHDLSGAPSCDQLSLITREPLGVVGIITPWNDPLVVSMWKLAPALLMGNSVIMKPAEQSSYSLLRVAALAHRAGIPAGVLNVLPGRGERIGRAIATHMDIRGVFFTGSSSVGKEILRGAGESNMKKVGLECGGKSAFIVSDKCLDLRLAARTLAKSMFYNQGQICSAPSRAILHNKIKNEFIEHLIAEMPAFIPGDPLNPETRVGATASKEQYDRIQDYIQQAIDRGLRCIRDGFEPPYAGGYYVAPTVFPEVPPDDPLAREEIFGPVLITHSFDRIGDAIELANDSRFGLAASIWSNDLDEALHCSRGLEAGIVHVNSYGDDDNTVPFGGIKESGIGRDKSLLAFDDYSTLKTTWFRLGNAAGKQTP